MGRQARELAKRRAARAAAAAAAEAAAAAAAAAAGPTVTAKKRKRSGVAERDEANSLDRVSSMNRPHAPQPTPLRPILGKRSTTQAYAESLKWTCECGKTNLPRRGLIEDIPVLECDCGRESKVQFDFSLANVEINGQCPIVQENVKLQKSVDCILCATASNIEITLRMQSILSGQKLERSQPLINLKSLHSEYERIRALPGVNKERKWDDDTLTVLASIAKVIGVVTKEKEPKLHKIPEYVRVKNNFYDIVRVLADGHPLTTGFIHGKNFKDLKPGQIYKAPREEALIGKSRTGHSILLVGAGRRGNTNYYHFLNSWGAHFCLEAGESGERYGFGMIRASDIRIQPLKFVRYKEEIEYHNMLSSTDLAFAKAADSKQGGFGECPKPEYGSLDMAAEMPFHDLLENSQSNFQQSLSANPIVPRFGGMPHKKHDERVSLRLALQANDELFRQQELENYKEEAQANKSYMLQYKEIASSNEAALKQMESAYQDYETKVILQSETIQELTNTSKQSSLLQQEIAILRQTADEQKAENDALRTSGEQEKIELIKEKDEALRKYNEPNDQIYAAAGTVKQNNVNSLLMLLRLRQACDYPHLVEGHGSSWISFIGGCKETSSGTAARIDCLLAILLGEKARDGCFCF